MRVTMRAILAVAGLAAVVLTTRVVNAATPEAARSRAATAAIESSTASDASASAPSDLSVTVYRAPDRGTGSIDLDALAGFALISETRTVHLPAGVSRLRFDGVADGIEPASAIVTGLAEGVIEKKPRRASC